MRRYIESNTGKSARQGKNQNIYYSSQWAHNRGKQIAYIDHCHWGQLYIYIYIYIRLKIKPNSVRIRF